MSDDITPDVQAPGTQPYQSDDLSSELSRHVENVTQEFEASKAAQGRIQNASRNHSPDRTANGLGQTKDISIDQKIKATPDLKTIINESEGTLEPQGSLNSKMSPIMSRDQYAALASDRSKLNGLNATNDKIVNSEEQLKFRKPDIEQEGGKKMNILDIEDDGAEREGGDKKEVVIQSSKVTPEEGVEVQPGSSKRMMIISVIVLLLVAVVIGVIVGMDGGSAPAAANTPQSAAPAAPQTKIDKQEVTSIISTQLETIFQSEPKISSSDVISLWKSQGPFDLQAALDQKKLSIDKDYYIAEVSPKDDSYSWDGQSYLQQAQGVGRNLIKEDNGIYEGVYKNDGKANGYGRYIFSKGSVYAMYTGNFKDSIPDGIGTYQTFEKGGKNAKLEQEWKDVEKMGGTWKAAVLVSPKNEKNKGKNLAAVIPILPTVLIKLTPTVKSLSENMVKTPAMPASIKVAPAKKQQFNKMVETWQKSKPLNINNLEKSGLVKVDPSLKVTQLHSSDYVYNGQVIPVPNASRRRLAAGTGTHIVSQGIGQQYGTWGIYEGEFDKGSITGYGRIIMPSQNVYVGQVVKGAFDGKGTLTLKDGTKKTGTWKDNKLILTPKGEKTEYVADNIKPPKVMRIIPKEETDLLEIFKAEPTGVNSTVLDQWKKAGPFQLENYINNNTIYLNQTQQITTIYNSTSKTSFSGQIRVNETIGLYSAGEKYFENYNINNVAQPFGIGRIVFPDQIFEGYIDIDNLMSLDTNKIFRIITKDGARIYNSKQVTKQEISDYNDTKVFVQTHYHFDSQYLKFKEMYANVTKLSQNVQAKLQKSNNALWFEQQYLKGIWTLDPAANVYYDTNKNNFILASSLRDQNLETGFGRRESENQLYDGQLKEGFREGYGIIMIYSFNFKTWDVQQGYFYDSDYKAVNKTVFQLNELFDSKYKSPYDKEVRQENFDLANLLKTGKISMYDNNLLGQQWPLEVSTQGSTETSLYDGILKLKDQSVVGGLFRKYTKKQNGEMIVMEGTSQYYRTIDNKGNIKWFKGGIEISSENQKSLCNGLIQNITSPKPIIVFPYQESDNSVKLNLNATQYFKNQDPKLCPITNCSLWQQDNLQYEGEISLGPEPFFNILAISNKPGGYNQSIYIVCSNEQVYGSSSAYTRIQVNQSRCVEGKTCPKKEDVDKDTNGTCDGKLEPKSQEKVTWINVNFTESDEYQWSKNDTLDFFTNSDPKNCPITNCSLRQADCNQTVGQGYKVEQTQGKYGIYAIANQRNGWKNQLCLICANKDQIVQTQIGVNQTSCTYSGNCPKIQAGGCKGQLNPVQRANRVIVPYTNDDRAHYSKINGDQFFVNKNDFQCPITKCQLRESDCRTNYTGGVYIDEKAPFGIFVHSDFPIGWLNPLCLICENQDEPREIRIEVNQLSCKESGNCGKIYNVTGNDTKEGPCYGTLDHISNPQSIVIPYNPTSEEQYVRRNATEFFISNNTKCPITNCTLKQPNCKDDYTDGISVDFKDPFGIFAISNFPDGWIDPLCLICKNKNQAVAVEIVVDQLSCKQTGNCQSQEKITNQTLTNCAGHLTKIQNPPPVIFPFTPSAELQYLPIGKTSALSYFKNDDPQNCPVTQCQLRQTDCKTSYPDDDGIFVNETAPFLFSAYTNFTQGWNDPLCLACSNQDETVSIQIGVNQTSCAQTGNCPGLPVGTCKGELIEDLGHIKAPKPIIVPFAQTDSPRDSGWFGPMIIVSKNPQKCPIKSCSIKELDCKTPYDNKVSIDPKLPFGIFVISNFPEGHIDKVCLVCENQDDSLSVNITVDQLPKGSTTTQYEKGQCKGKLTSVIPNAQNSKIIIPFANTKQQLYTKVNAQQFFLNEDPEICPITNCHLMHEGCKKNYTTEVFVDKKAPFGIFAQQNYPDGWVDPVCVMCSNVDETVTYNVEIDQLSCTQSKNCPNAKDLVPTKVPAGACKGNLTAITNPEKIVVPFDIRTNHQYSRVNAMTYFTNKFPEICPITSCYLMMPGCKQNYTQEIYVDQNAPFGIFSQQNYPEGWNDPVCLMCSNQDETTTIDFEINQLSCGQSKNCPQDVQPSEPPAPQAKPGQCKNHLIPIKNPQKVVLPYDFQEKKQYTRVDAQNFFTNDDPQNCPIKGCQLLQPGCKKSYTDEITVDSQAPFGIFALQNYPDGWLDPVCLNCSNQDETVTINIEIDQLSCKDSNNCPAEGTGRVTPKANPGECKGHLEAIANPQNITIPFDDRTLLREYTRANGLQFYTNDDPQVCPITSCQLMRPGCKVNYSSKDGVSVDANFPFGLFALQNFTEGQTYNICLKCANQDQNVTANFTVTQAKCGTQGSGPCPNIAPIATNDKSGECYGSLKAQASPKQIQAPYTPYDQSNYVGVDAPSFFVSTNNKCPITRCNLFEPDCKSPYKGVTIDQNKPFGFFAQTNYPKGWTDPMCVTCQNKDQIVQQQIEFKQGTCQETKNCPG